MSEASREFVVALEGLMESFQQEQRDLFRDRKVSAVQFFVLRWLTKSSEANMTALARMLGIRPQSVTPIVDSLEQEGLLRRVRSTEDRRESRLELTPKGVRLRESLRAGFREVLGKALDEAPATSLRAAARALRIASAALERDQARARRRHAAPRRDIPDHRPRG